MQHSLLKKSIVEALGTFALLFAATGVIINKSFDLLGIALAPGIVVAILIVTSGHISGIHLNPAVSFAFLLAKKMTPNEFFAYLVAQFIGAAAASFALRSIYTESVASVVRNGVNTLAPGTSYVTGFAIELVLTFILVMVIFAIAIDKDNPRASWAPVAVGLTIAVNNMAMGPITGACFNPVRWFGPALAGGYWENSSLYLVAPMIGAAIAVPFFTYLSSGPGRKPE